MGRYRAIGTRLRATPVPWERVKPSSQATRSAFAATPRYPSPVDSKRGGESGPGRPTTLLGVRASDEVAASFVAQHTRVMTSLSRGLWVFLQH